ncbi:hypothetical protein [Sorangium sp. So ce117]|uniref:hypothetical protein n=1 Tax=Sorangium sp. So ce117 TaxID=3133277 RepID=UPI003F639D4C
MNIMKRVFGIALVSIAACGSLLLATPRADAGDPGYAILDLSCDAKTGQLVAAKGATLASDVENYYVRRDCPNRQGDDLLMNREPLAQQDCPEAAKRKDATDPSDVDPRECFKLALDVPRLTSGPSTLWFSSRDNDPQTALTLTLSNAPVKIDISEPTWTVALELDYAPDGSLRLVHPTAFTKKLANARYAVAVYNAPPQGLGVFIEGEQAFPAKCAKEKGNGATCFDVPMLAGVNAGYKTQLDFSTTSAGAFTRLAFELDAGEQIRATLVAGSYDYYQALQSAYAQVSKRITKGWIDDCIDKNKTDAPQNIYCPARNFAILFFDETGASPFAMERIDEDDEVVIVVVPRNGKPIQELALTTCGNADQARVVGNVVAVNGALARGTEALGRGAQSADAQAEKIEQAREVVSEQKAEAKKNQERAAELASRAASLSTPTEGEAGPKEESTALAQQLDNLSRDQDVSDALKDEQAKVKDIKDRIANDGQITADEKNAYKKELDAQRESAQKDILAERYAFEQKARQAEQNAASAEREVRTLQAQLQANTAVRMLVAKHCASPRMQLTVRGEGQTQSSQISIETLPIYKFSVGLALIADWSTKVEYRSTSMKGETVPVIRRFEKTQGIAPPIPFIAWRPWGTNIDRKRRALSLEGIGVGVGISLVEPLEHIYPGAFYEFVPGFGLLAGAHWQTVPELTGGHKENDRVPAGQFDVERKWKAAPGFFAGVNLDAALFLKLVGAVGAGR